MPEHFCTPMKGIDNGTSLYVTIYPVAWRIEVVNDELHRGSGYVRSVLEVTQYPGVVR